MTRYKPFNARNSAIAFVCSIVFSASCLMFAIGPAIAAPKATPHSVVLPLA